MVLYYVCITLCKIILYLPIFLLTADLPKTTFRIARAPHSSGSGMWVSRGTWGRGCDLVVLNTSQDDSDTSPPLQQL